MHTHTWVYRLTLAGCFTMKKHQHASTEEEKEEEEEER